MLLLLTFDYQAVVMTYPLIGNYGMAEDDFETAVPTIGALIVSEYNNAPSNFPKEYPRYSFPSSKISLQL